MGPPPCPPRKGEGYRRHTRAAYASHGFRIIRSAPVRAAAERIVESWTRTAVVTGAASGLGRASAEALSRLGWTVVAAGLEPAMLEETAARIRRSGGSAVVVECDISDASAVERMASVAEELGGADVLVNNAAVIPESKAWQDINEADWERLFAVNVKGYWLCARALREQMVSRGGGSIVNLSSIVWMLGFEELAAYVSSKAAVVGLTRALARELGPFGIRVNAIAPGAFPTRAEEIHPDAEAYNRFVLSQQALKRRGRPEDIANVVAFLAGESSSFVTGQTLVVDGGWVMS